MPDPNSVENTSQNKEVNGKDEVRWNFWFLVAFTGFLFVIFVLYLPLRFYHEAAGPGHIEEAADTPAQEATGAVYVHGGPSFYHEESAVKEGLAVNLNISPVPFRTNQVQILDFLVNEKPGNIPVPAENLEIEHTKPMHVIGVRSDMNEFFHIHPHPTSTPGHLIANHVFSKPGLYKIWSEIKKDGVNHTFGHSEISVAGEGAKSEKEVSFGRNFVVGPYQVSLKTDEPVAKGREHEFSFDIHAFNGDEVGTEDYLGAKMHLTIIKDDWKQFIHTHPEEGDHHALLRSDLNSVLPEARANGNEEVPGTIHEEGEDEVINFRVVFPEAGLYKMFAQFRPQGINLPQDEALTAEFWAKVEERAPSGISSWWILLIASAILIVLLSLGIRRFLQVDPKKIKALTAE